MAISGAAKVVMESAQDLDIHDVELSVSEAPIHTPIPRASSFELCCCCWQMRVKFELHTSFVY